MQLGRRGCATATVGQGSGGRFLTGRPPQYLPLSLDEVFEDAIGSYSMSQAAAAASRTPVATTGPILSVNNIEVIYDHVILVLKGVSLEVPRGGIVALLGANGAGKTTTLKAISKLLRAERSEERRVGNECVSPCRLRGSPYH